MKLQLPKHDRLTIYINNHLSYYETAEQSISDRPNMYRFESPEARLRAVASNSVALVEWPSGDGGDRRHAAGSTLDDALRFARTIAGEGPCVEARCGLPPAECATFIEHNPHLALSQDVVDMWLEIAAQRDGVTIPDEASDDERRLLAWLADKGAEDFQITPGDYGAWIGRGDVWTLQWYPHTPIGSCMVAASSFEELLVAAGGA